MKNDYRIELDLAHDAQNWYDSTRSGVFQGWSWRDGASGRFRDEFDQIASLPKKKAKAEAERFVFELHNEKSGEFNSLKWWIENEFAKKFDDACGWLEKTTGQDLACREFTIYLTTFPRADESLEKGEIWFCVYWVNPIENFLHEVLHWQFHRYWREDPQSPVAKLSDGELEFLKESLTVIIDDELKPLVNLADTGYPAHQAFRHLLHREWQKYHDFDKLVNFGLKNLPKFAKKML